MTRNDLLDQGACVGSATPDLWFAEEDTNAGKAAIAICETCPVIEECAQEAIRAGEKNGIWGGRAAFRLDNSGFCPRGHARSRYGKCRTRRGGWRCSMCEFLVRKQRGQKGQYTATRERGVA